MCRRRLALPNGHASFRCMNLSRNACIALSWAVICGCSNTSSENVTTQGIHADIDVIASGSGATVVTAELEVGTDGFGRTSLELTGGDSLTVLANGMQKTMTEDSSVIGRFSYSASFDFDDADTIFTVAFNRDNGVNAPNSNVALPAGFIVASPSSNDVLSSTDDIPISWMPSGTPIVPSIHVTLTCTLTNGLTVSDFETVSLSSDSGATSLPVAAVIPQGTLDTTRLCEGNVDLSRWRRGNLDPNYGEGGEISAEHYEDAQFFVDLSL